MPRIGCTSAIPGRCDCSDLRHPYGEENKSLINRYFVPDCLIRQHIRQSMKRKNTLTYLFLLLSIIMLSVPVIPHHHHSDGLICLKEDVSTDCCEHTARHTQENASHEAQTVLHTHTADHGHCCCDTGCLTTHFFQQSPAHPDNGWTYPEFSWIITLYPDFISSLLHLPETASTNDYCVYRERLHGTFLTRAKGLRAPPASVV